MEALLPLSHADLFIFCGIPNLHTCIWGLLLDGAARIFSLATYMSRPGFEPTSKESHPHGTFERRSIDWATAPQRLFLFLKDFPYRFFWTWIRRPSSTWAWRRARWRSSSTGRSGTTRGSDRRWPGGWDKGGLVSTSSVQGNVWACVLLLASGPSGLRGWNLVWRRGSTLKRSYQTFGLASRPPRTGGPKIRGSGSAETKRCLSGKRHLGQCLVSHLTVTK